MPDHQSTTEAYSKTRTKRKRPWLRHISVVLTFVLACGSNSTVTLAQGTAPSHRRAEFAAALDRIECRTPAAEVRARLGAPDEIRTERTEEMKAGSTKVWCYGVVTPHGFPTLGRVYFDKFDRVALVVGNGGTPPSPDVIGESELREHLARIGRLPTPLEHIIWPRWVSRPYNPRHLLQAANPLIELGEEKATKVIDEYLRLCSNANDSRPRPIHGDADRILLLLLCVYEPTSGEPSPPKVGDPFGYFTPRSPNTPLMVVHDVPFIEPRTDGASTGTRPRQPTIKEFYAYCRKHRAFRTRPLRPPDDPSVFAGNADISPDQLARLMETVVPLSPPDRRGLVSPSASLDSIECRWDETSLRYVFPDGSSLPEQQMNRTQFSWQTDVEGREMTVRIWRRDETHVVVTITYQPTDVAPSIDDPNIRLIDVNSGAAVDEGISLIRKSLLTGSKPVVRAHREFEWISGLRLGSLQVDAPARIRIEFVGDGRTIDASEEFDI